MNDEIIDARWRATAGEGVRLIVPDGCLDVVARHGALQVVGPMTRPLWVAVSEPCEGIRFRPAAVRQWMGVSPKEFVDLIVDTREIRTLRSARTLDDIVALTRGTDVSLATVQAVSCLQRTPSTRIADIAITLGMSDRHLRRLFADEVGLSPRCFARICRFRAFLQKLWTASERPLAYLAWEAAYADQAHMNREVKEFASTTPTQLRHLVSDSFKAYPRLVASM